MQYCIHEGCSKKVKKYLPICLEHRGMQSQKCQDPDCNIKVKFQSTTDGKCKKHTLIIMANGTVYRSLTVQEQRLATRNLQRLFRERLREAEGREQQTEQMREYYQSQVDTFEEEGECSEEERWNERIRQEGQIPDGSFQDEYEQYQYSGEDQ